MSTEPVIPSARKIELLEGAYAYVMTHGVSEVSLRPLAAAIGSSPRVLLFLFGSKDGLIRALLARARVEECDMLDRLRSEHPDADLTEAVLRVWDWLSNPARRDLVSLWAECYTCSLVNPSGPWSDFARQTVADWLEVFARYQPESLRATADAVAQRSAALALLRGALLDLLATGDQERTTAAVHHQLKSLGPV
jgi:AcrR family transcriptional regulator